MTAAAARPEAVTCRETLWREFLSRAANGEHDAFAAFYDATSSLVFSLALRILGNRADAEEVAHDVYMQVWRNAATFDEQRGSVTSWLVMLARSRALDRYRSVDARQRRDDAAGTFISPAPPTPEDLAFRSQDRRHVADALASLSPEQREAIELAYFQGLSQSELAERLALPLGTVKTRIRLGMIKLRERLGARTN